VLQKYFIAIVPPEPLLSQIQEIKSSIFDVYGTKGALRSPGHITLHMPFSWEEEKEEKLISSLQNFSFEKEFQVTLSGFSCFEPRVVFINVLENDLLFQMQQQLVRYAKQNLQLFNQSDDMRGFHPHVTIAFRDLKKPLFYKMWEEYKNKVFDATFTCKDICLLKHLDDKWEVYKTFSLVK
jgi:2'-5' RNA ligase